MVIIEENYFDTKFSVYTTKDEFRYDLDNMKNCYWQGPLQVPDPPKEDV
jgi:hypothetical protein